MKYFKAEGGVVVQVICNTREGFQETKENIVFGMLFDGVNFTNPERPATTVLEKIEALENTVTPRNLRGAIAGIQYDIDVINNINADIAALALQLR